VLLVFFGKGRRCVLFGQAAREVRVTDEIVLFWIIFTDKCDAQCRSDLGDVDASGVGGLVELPSVRIESFDVGPEARLLFRR